MLRKRIHAWLLSRGDDYYESAYADRKGAIIAALSGIVVEIGPGGGNNLPYYRKDVKWIGVEPNPFLHYHIRKRADRLGLTIQLREESAEMVGLDDECADNVVGTLVLCSVDHPAQALAEIHRILKPGGTFVFVEHVAAPHDTLLRGLQRLIRPAWQCLTDGCRPDRDTLGSIERAGFRHVQSARFRLPVPIVAPHIIGVATK